MGLKKRIVLLGATGSIGKSTLEVIRKYGDRLELVGVAANRDWEGLGKIFREFGVQWAVLSDEEGYRRGKESGMFERGELSCGIEGIREMVVRDGVDMIVVGMSGVESLWPVMDAIEAGKTIGLANKEVLVMAGGLMMGKARERGVELLPLDSEHSAVWQCLRGNDWREVRKVILTASGGAFWGKSEKELRTVSVADALKHPTWDMGAKVTLDCATLANKGLELIEAHYLFGLEAEKLDVLVHRQSIVHSLVEFVDGNVMGHFSRPHMTYPIQYALLYPERQDGVMGGFDFRGGMTLTFEEVDLGRYPCLRLAWEAMKGGDRMGTVVFNAANEVAAHGFLDGKLDFMGIAGVVEAAMEKGFSGPETMEGILEVDRRARIYAGEVMMAKSKL